MKCALAAMGFIDGDIQYNKSVIIDTMKNYSDTADIVIFGEAFLQGFYCADFNVEHDEKIAVSRNLCVQSCDVRRCAPCLKIREYDFGLCTCPVFAGAATG